MPNQNPASISEVLEFLLGQTRLRGDYTPQDDYDGTCDQCEQDLDDCPCDDSTGDCDCDYCNDDTETCYNCGGIEWSDTTPSHHETINNLSRTHNLKHFERHTLVYSDENGYILHLDLNDPDNITINTPHPHIHITPHISLTGEVNLDLTADENTPVNYVELTQAGEWIVDAITTHRNAH